LCRILTGASLSDALDHYDEHNKIYLFLKQTRSRISTVISLASSFALPFVLPETPTILLEFRDIGRRVRLLRLSTKKL